jgi:phosphatidate cytidylyltransferase
MTSVTNLRFLTAAILIPAVAAAIWWSPTWMLAGVASMVAVLALIEFFAMGERIGLRGYRLWTCLTALGIFAQQWYASQAASIEHLGDLFYRARAPRVSLELVLVFFVLGVAVIALGTRRAPAGIFSSVSVSAAGLVVIVIPLSAVVRLHGVDAVGRQLLLFTLVVVWVGDSAAYFAGHAFGRWKMSPQLSPNKTWEGAGANLLGALLVGALWMKIPAARMSAVAAPAHMLAMATLASVAGQVGDVFESAFKRSAGVKDSGTLVPGHGGMLDRIDSLILAAPAVWYYFQWFVTRRI